MIVQKGRYFEMWKTITAPSAVSCWASHGTEANPNLPRRWLKIPHCELSIQRNDRMPGSAGTAQGIRKSAARTRIHANWKSRIPERRSARKSFTLTANPTYQSVLTTVCRKVGSEKRAVAVGVEGVPDAERHRVDHERREEDEERRREEEALRGAGAEDQRDTRGRPAAPLAR